jgi:hypothetical protein
MGGVGDIDGGIEGNLRRGLVVEQQKVAVALGTIETKAGGC